MLANFGQIACGAHNFGKNADSVYRETAIYRVIASLEAIVIKIILSPFTNQVSLKLGHCGHLTLLFSPLFWGLSALELISKDKHGERLLRTDAVR